MKFGYLITCILTVILFVQCKQSDRGKVKENERPVSVSTFSLKNTTSQELLQQIATHKSKRPVLVNFWATWCKPCIEELPYLLQLQKTYAKEVQFYFVSMDFPENREKAGKFIQSLGADFETYFNSENEQTFLNNFPDTWTGALPYTVVYAKDGGLHADFMGEASKDEFEKIIKQVL